MWCLAGRLCLLLSAPPATWDLTLKSTIQTCFNYLHFPSHSNLSLSTSSREKTRIFSSCFGISLSFSLIPNLRSCNWVGFGVLFLFSFPFFFSFQLWLEKIKAWRYCLGKGTSANRALSFRMQMGRSSGRLKGFETTALTCGDCTALRILPENTRGWILSPSLLLDNTFVHD